MGGNYCKGRNYKIDSKKGVVTARGRKVEANGELEHRTAIARHSYGEKIFKSQEKIIIKGYKPRGSRRKWYTQSRETCKKEMVSHSENYGNGKDGRKKRETYRKLDGNK